MSEPTRDQVLKAMSLVENDLDHADEVVKLTEQKYRAAVERAQALRNARESLRVALEALTHSGGTRPGPARIISGAGSASTRVLQVLAGAGAGLDRDALVKTFTELGWAREYSTPAPTIRMAVRRTIEQGLVAEDAEGILTITSRGTRRLGRAGDAAASADAP